MQLATEHVPNIKWIPSPARDADANRPVDSEDGAIDTWGQWDRPDEGSRRAKNRPLTRNILVFISKSKDTRFQTGGIIVEKGWNFDWKKTYAQSQ